MVQPRFELISFKTCPFVQRSRITLLHKGIDHDVTYIDLDDPPAWFPDVSPLGKVPVLRVHTDDGTTDLFESAVINEYLDTVTHGNMLPGDPLERAMDRAWIEFASELNVVSYEMITAKDKDSFEDHRQHLGRLLDTLEAKLDQKPFWHGADLSLVDTSFAPFLQRALVLHDTLDVLHARDHPKVHAWAKVLVAHPAVQASGPEDLADAYRESIEAQGGYLATRLMAAT